MKDDPGSNIKFVKIIEKHPCLYNSTLPEYSRKDITDDAWLEVAKEVNDSVFHCKEKWKNLRTVFVRHSKLEPLGRTKKPYYLKEAMQFILPYVRPTPRMNVHVPQPVENTDEPSVDCEQNRDVHVLNGAPHPDETNDFRKSEPRVLLKVQDSLLNCKRESDEFGEVDESFHDPMGPRKKVRCNGYFRKMFLLSLLPEINDMTEMQMRKFKRRVLEVIDEILTEDPAASGGYTPYDSFSVSSYAPSTSESSDFLSEPTPKEPSPI